MTIHLDRSDEHDIAVLHGIDTDAAILHLCRSLVTGSVFDVYRALVVDLGGREPSEEAADALATAATARLGRQQLFTAATDAEAAARAVRGAGAWLRFNDSGNSSYRGQSVARAYAGLMLGLAEASVRAGVSCAKGMARRATRS
jgi:hypothetical protein